MHIGCEYAYMSTITPGTVTEGLTEALVITTTGNVTKGVTGALVSTITPSTGAEGVTDA